MGRDLSPMEQRVADAILLNWLSRYPIASVAAECLARDGARQAAIIAVRILAPSPTEPRSAT